MKLFNADGAGGSGGAGEGAAAAGASADGGDVNYEAPTNVRSGAGTAGEAGDGGEGAAAGSGEGAAAEGEGEGAAAAAGEGTTATGEGEGAGGGKGRRTLVGDLQAERSRRQAAEGLLESWKPVLERLEGREDLQRAVVEGRITIAQAENTKANEERAELEDIANDYGWFKDDGITPDLDKAQKHLGRIRKEAARIAGAEAQPARQYVANQQANARIDQAVQYAEREGIADPAFVRDEFVKVARANPNALLDDKNGNALYEMIVGKAVRAGKVGKGRARAGTGNRGGGEGADGGEHVFVHTESPGGRRESAGPKLTPAEKELGQQYGLTDKDWQLAERHSGVRRGYTALTED